MKGTVDIFLATLLIALILIVLLFSIFNYTSIGIKEIKNNTNATNMNQINNTVMAQEKWRSINLGDFNTSVVSEKKVYELNNQIVQNGLLFGSKTVKIHYVLPENSNGFYIQLNVEKTNEYAPIVVKVNNNVVAKDTYLSGVYDIVVNSSIIKKNNIIEIYAVSSSWKIWAPTYYKFKSIKIISDAQRISSSSFDFVLYDNEVNNFEKGWLSLDLLIKRGKLVYSLNGKEQYIGEPKSNSLPFSPDALKIGRNTLTLSCEGDCEYTGTARFVVYYYE